MYTTVAEKLDALVTLGMVNTRMKDFYDLWYLSRSKMFDGTILLEAVCATFDRRNTEASIGQPVAFTDEFAYSSLKTSQWLSFLRKSQLSGAPELHLVLAAISSWLGPVLACVRPRRSFTKTWTPDTGWH
jgi:Nucleotidyl transferase AbiEii toxin, Type IV TA system